MTNIAKISVSLEADIDKFQRGMVKASGILSTFQLNLGTLAGKAVDAFAVAGTAAAAGLAVLITNSIDTITANTRLADRLQLSTQALGGFQLAARSVGVDAETATGFLTHLSVSVGEAQNGSEELQGTFARLGIDLQSFIQLNNDQKLNAIADAFAKIGSAAERADLAKKLGGRSGAELVNVLAKGSAGLQEATDKATNFGLAINRVDSAKVEQAHQAFEDLKATIDGLITQLTVQLSPFISALAKQVTEWATSSKGNVMEVQDGFESFLETLAEISDYFSLLKAGFYGLQVVGSAVVGAIVYGWYGLIKVIELSINKISDWTGWFDKIDISSGLEEQARGSFIVAADAAEKAGKAWDEFAEGAALDKVKSTFAKIRIDAELAAKATAQAVETANAKGGGGSINDDKWFDKQLEKAEQLAKALQTPIQKFTQTMLDTVELLKNGFINGDLFDRALDKAQDDFLKASSGPKANNSFKEVNTAFMSIDGLKEGKTKAQEITSPQLNEMTKILNGIQGALGYLNSRGVLIGA